MSYGIDVGDVTTVVKALWAIGSVIVPILLSLF